MRSNLLPALLAAVVLTGVVVLPTTAATQTMAPACAGANLRTGSTTSAAIKVSLGLANTVTITGTVSGGSWSTSCPATVSGSTWYVVSEVNGRTTTSLYGVAQLYAATGVLKSASAAAPTAAPAPTPTTTPTPTPIVAPTAAPSAAPAASTPTPVPAPATGTTMVPACDGINLRTSTSTSATIKVKLGLNASVVVSGQVAGSAWSASCPTAKAASTWYVVTSVNGTPVGALYGVSALYAATGVLSAPTSPSTVGVTTLGSSTVFFGRGWGHGVGLSQYGARGRSLAGQLAPEILAHYFQGTTIGALGSDMAIRVLVLPGFAPTATAPLTIYGRGGPWQVLGSDPTYPADARLRILPPTAPETTPRMVIDLAGTVLFDGPAPADFRLRPTTDAGLIQLFSKPTTYDRFRGTLRVMTGSAGIDVVDELPLETYLRGVVPAEMPSSWPTEARVAQTIAARSYAAVRVHPATGTFDVYDDTRSQVYLGALRETAAADAVIAATAGQVLRSGAAIANALFHSTGGGATENNENVFTSATGARTAGIVSYLRGSSDRDPSGAPYDAGAPYTTWQTRAYSVAELSAIFGADSRTSVGTLTGFDFRNRGVSGRLVSVTLVGSAGTKTVAGNVFVAVFNAGRPSGDPMMASSLLDVAPIP